MAKYSVPKIEELLEAGVHFGHQVKRWNPGMEKYIYSQRMGIHVFDLEQTHELLKNACEFLCKTAAEGGTIIFVGTKKQARDIIEIEAKRSGALYVTERWIGGTITNFRMIKRNIEKYLDYLKKKESGELAKYTKKERLLIDREVEKLRKSIGGISSLKGKPSVLFTVDARRERTCIDEAGKFGVSVVALVDTNSDPKGISYIIPGNDDAIRSIAMIVKALADAVEAGYKEFEKKSEKPSFKPESVTGTVEIEEVEAEKKKRGRPKKAK